ncbi:MAG: DUF7453 family protein [Phycisphaerales bacterium]
MHASAAVSSAMMLSLSTGLVHGQVELHPIGMVGAPSGLAGPIGAYGRPFPITDRRFALGADFQVPNIPGGFAIGVFSAEPNGAIIPVSAYSSVTPLPEFSGVDGLAFRSIKEAITNDRGEFLIAAEVFNPTFTFDDIAMLAGAPGDLRLLTRFGEPAPDRPGFVIRSLRTGLREFDTTGRAVFPALITPSASDPLSVATFVLYRDEGGALVELIGPGRPLPGIAGSTVVSFNAARVTPDGGFVLTGTFDLPGSGGVERYSGIVRLRGGGEAVRLLETGEPLPLSVVTGSAFQRGVSTDSVLLAVPGRITPDAIALIDDDRVITVLAEVGTTAPVLPAEIEALGPPRINDAGQVIFSARLSVSGGSPLTEDNDSAVFLYEEGSTVLLAQEGSPIPGVPGAVFNDLFDDGDFSNRLSYAIAPDGSAVFYDWNPDARNDEDTETGLYASLPDGNGGRSIAAVVRDGQTVDIDPDPAVTDERTIDMLPDFFSELERFAPSISDNRTVGFRAFVNVGSNPSLFSSVAFVATLPGSACRADLNRDGLLDAADFTAWLAAYQASLLRADQNGNGVLDPGDFAAWIANLNHGC